MEVGGVEFEALEMKVMDWNSPLMSQARERLHSDDVKNPVLSARLQQSKKLSEKLQAGRGKSPPTVIHDTLESNVMNVYSHRSHWSAKSSAIEQRLQKLLICSKNLDESHFPCCGTFLDKFFQTGEDLHMTSIYVRFVGSIGNSSAPLDTKNYVEKKNVKVKSFVSRFYHHNDDQNISMLIHDARCHQRFEMLTAEYIPEEVRIYERLAYCLIIVLCDSLN